MYCKSECMLGGEILWGQLIPILRSPGKYLQTKPRNIQVLWLVMQCPLLTVPAETNTFISLCKTLVQNTRVTDSLKRIFAVLWTSQCTEIVIKGMKRRHGICWDISREFIGWNLKTVNYYYYYYYYHHHHHLLYARYLYLYSWHKLCP